jgi:hypothetical protein
MPASTHTTSPSPVTHSTRPCTECGARELQRKPRSFFQKLFALYPYVCLQCAHRNVRFRIKAWGVVRLLVLVAIPAGIVLYREKRVESAPNARAHVAGETRRNSGDPAASEQIITKKPRTIADNAAILKMWRANVGTDVILQLIRTSTPDYDLSATSVIELKQAGVDQSIIIAMIDASDKVR